MPSRHLLACLVLSGFSGLAYELLWTRLLALSFGATVLSFSTVLAVFFGGLALGAHLAGKRSKRLTRPVRVYAAIEIGTGAIGLLLYPVLVNLDSLFALIDPGAGLSGAIVRLLVATPLLLVPTVLMGATLPVVSRAMIVDDQNIGRGTALIYGFNTLGAFLGVYMITYHVLPAIGVFSSILLAAAVNVLAGVAALAGERAPIEAVATPAPENIPHPKLLSIAAALAFFCGFSAICFQVVWVRIFSTFLHGTVYGVGAVLISVLVGIGAGSIFIARPLRHAPHAGLYLALLQIISIAAVLLLSENLLWVGYQLRALAWGHPPGITALHVQLAVTFAVLFIPAFTSGASFPVLVHLAERRAERAGSTVGTLYAANTVGSILGSLLTGFVLIPAAGSDATMLVGITVTALVGAAAAMLFRGAPLSKLARITSLAFAALSLSGVALFDGLELRGAFVWQPYQRIWPEHRAAIQSQLQNQLYFAEGEAATVSVFAQGGARMLTLNGMPQGGRRLAPPHHYLESSLVALVPLAHMEPPKKVMVVGLGAGVTVDVMRKLDVPDIEVLELEPKIVEAVHVIFEGDDPLESKQVHVTFDDARHHLLIGQHRGGHGYDLIASMPADPWISAPIFTREFFETARANLSEKGIFSTWFGTGRMDGPGVESLFRAFTSVFPYYAAYWVPEGGAYYLVGATHPLRLDVERLRALQRRPELEEHAVLRNEYFLPLRTYATGDASTPPAPEGVVNTDDSAFIEAHAPRATNISPVLEGFMPRELLAPAMIDETIRHDFYLELLEQLLGTPRGRIPHLPPSPAPSPVKAKRTFEAAKPLFAPNESTYLEGRLALARGETTTARELLERARQGSFPSELADRAGRFLAMTMPRGSLGQLQALHLAPPSADVIAEMLAIDPSQAMLRVPSLTAQEPQAAREPIGWLLLRAAQEAPAPLTAEEKKELLPKLGRELAQTDNRGLLELAETFFRRTGDLGFAEGCARWRENLTTSRTKDLVREAAALYARKEFAEASRILRAADRQTPGDVELLGLWLQAAISAGDRAAIEEIKTALAFFGKSERQIRQLE